MFGIRPLRQLLLATTLVVASSSWAAYPEKPVRLVIPYPPGGTVDAMMRSLQDQFQRITGQPLVIDNKGGAAGVTGMQEVARAAPDGYTIGFTNSGLVIAPLLQTGVVLDSARDFAPITMVANGTLMMFAHPRVPGNDVGGLVSYAKSRPDGLNYSSTGQGGAGHLAAELLSRASGAKLVHIPYRGNAPAMLAVMQGEVDFVISTMSDTAIQSVQARKLKLLGVTTKNAFPLMPDVPPIAATYPGFDVEIWVALVAPRGTPPQVIATLNKAFNEILAAPEMRKRYEGYGFIPSPSTPELVSEKIQHELKTWLPLIKEKNIKAE